MLGYATTFGEDLSLQITYTDRTTEDILEDYDLGLYADPNGNTAAGRADENSLFYLPLSYFGYDNLPNSNYVIATLAGGQREYKDFIVILQKKNSKKRKECIYITPNTAQDKTQKNNNP